MSACANLAPLFYLQIWIRFFYSNEESTLSIECARIVALTPLGEINPPFSQHFWLPIYLLVIITVCM
jgi:hypothetical protein